MRIVTIISLAASAVLGLGALFIAKIALPNAASAKNPAHVQVAGSPMVVATKPIAYGDKLDPAMLTVVKVPANAIPQGAYTDVSQVLAADRGGAPVALFPMAPKEPILPAKLSGPGARASVAAEIADGMRAYTIKVTDVTGVGGHALPGDRVDVVLMRDLTPDGPQRSFVSYVVLQNVRVLGIDLNANMNDPKPSSPNTATLEVSMEDAQKLAMASSVGDLSLALRRTGAAEVAPRPPVRTADFLSGGGGGSTGGRVVRSGPGRQTYSAILIIEGQPTKRGSARGGGKGAGAGANTSGAAGTLGGLTTPSLQPAQAGVGAAVATGAVG